MAKYDKKKKSKEKWIFLMYNVDNEIDLYFAMSSLSPYPHRNHAP